ncbi:MAG: RNA methyltransferase [Lachnospiraceae bacterium]|nr:RNA methyltransferase [Lachnospiraceae bacterium]
MKKHPVIPVTSLLLPELDMYRQTREPQLEHYFEPERGVFMAESLQVVQRALDFGCEALSYLVEEAQLEKTLTMLEGYENEAPVYVASERVLQDLIGYRMTRGVLCAMRRPVLPAVSEMIGPGKRLAILENVVNPTNVGAIFRSAAALGMDGVLLTRGCADPFQRRACRVSMGTIFQVPWTYLDLPWPGEGMAFLREQGWTTGALALTDDSVSVSHPGLEAAPKLALILGTEGEGLLPETIRLADYTVKIPMSHGVDSLNVAAAAAVAFWEITRGQR